MKESSKINIMSHIAMQNLLHGGTKRGVTIPEILIPEPPTAA